MPPRMFKNPSLFEGQKSGNPFRLGGNPWKPIGNPFGNPGNPFGNPSTNPARNPWQIIKKRDKSGFEGQGSEIDGFRKESNRK